MALEEEEEEDEDGEEAEEAPLLIRKQLWLCEVHNHTPHPVHPLARTLPYPERVAVCGVARMRIPCVCYAYTMHAPCTHHAYTMRTPCIHHAYTILHAEAHRRARGLWRARSS